MFCTFFQLPADHDMFANAGGAQDKQVIAVVFDAYAKIDSFQGPLLPKGFSKFLQVCRGGKIDICQITSMVKFGRMESFDAHCLASYYT